MSTEEDIRKIEDEIARTQYNKATEKHIGKLKAKLAQLRVKQEVKSGKKSAGCSIRKSGNATVLLVGFPSVGKSTLLNRITNANSKVGDYEFTTLDVIPGMMEYKGAKIQVLDAPGVVEGAASGKGRGKEILSVVRAADLVLIMVDVDTLDKLKTIEKELYDAGFRLNQSPPDVKVYRKNTGGIKLQSGAKTGKLGRETIISVMNELGIHNAEVVIREDVSIDRFIDVLMKNRVYVPAIVLINKADIKRPVKTDENHIGISALKGEGINKLKELIWQKLKFMRVYMKKPSKESDKREPLILKKGMNVEDVCEWIHGDVKKDFRFAKLWGPSAKFPGQRVGFEHKLKDEDVLELHIE